jgi:putative nucleotidyltransferase with HDIG domain
VTAPLQALSAIVEGDAWLVGGALRDRLLGRPTTDFDVAVDADPRAAAKALAREAHAHVFALSEGFGAWRVIARDRSWQVDLLALGGQPIESDLARRDLTVNAIAQPLGGGDYVDPFGGLGDLRARRLRMVSAGAFADDPLRTIRLARLSCELSFAVERATAAAARANAPALDRVAPERIFAELKRIVSADRALQGLEQMDAVGVTAAVLPELTELRGIEQSHYHHLDVFEHTRAVLAETIELERDPGRYFGEHADAISRLLSEPLANELNRAQALRFGALLHDIAKPQTRRITTEGRVTFIGHDEAGAALSVEILSRLRAGDRLSEYVAALARHHLRLGFLVHQTPLGRRAIYDYLRSCDPVQVDITLLSVADRLATRGRGSEQAIAKHLELARLLLGEALAWRADPPRPPVRGDKLARALQLRPGPELGRILAELEAATFAGEISSSDQAIERARELMSGGAPADAGSR